VTTLQHSC